MDWWSVLPIAVGAVASNLVVVPRVQRLLVRRRLRAGQPTLTARSLAPARGTLPARWTPCRVTREGGRLVLRQLHDLWTVPGFDLLAVAGSDRPLVLGELLDGARRAVPVTSSAGAIEVAAPEEVLTWLEAQLAPADPA